MCSLSRACARLLRGTDEVPGKLRLQLLGMSSDRRGRLIGVVDAVGLDNFQIILDIVRACWQPLRPWDCLAARGGEHREGAECDHCCTSHTRRRQGSGSWILWALMSCTSVGSAAVPVERVGARASG